MSSENASETVATEPHRAGFVCLTGPTNAGKSTLMNAVIGHKIAIITPKPQTTRNRIIGIHNVGSRSSDSPTGGDSRGQLIFVDTPGLHRPRGKLSERMMDVAARSLEETDMALLVVDVTSDTRRSGELTGIGDLSPANRAALEQVKAAGVPFVIALNKVDLVRPKERLLPVIAVYTEASDGGEVVPISAREGDGLDVLEDLLLAQLPESPPLYPPDMLSNQAERFIAAELIREQVILQTKQELPYATAVEVEQWTEPSNPEDESSTLDIAAVIHVERESQKGIVIGKGGARVKSIGTAARKELERVYGRKIYLQLFVRVEKNWTRDGKRLDKMGY